MFLPAQFIPTSSPPSTRVPKSNQDWFLPNNIQFTSPISMYTIGLLSAVLWHVHACLKWRVFTCHLSVATIFSEDPVIISWNPKSNFQLTDFFSWFAIYQLRCHHHCSIRFSQKFAHTHAGSQNLHTQFDAAAAHISCSSQQPSNKLYFEVIISQQCGFVWPSLFVATRQRI